MNNSPGEKRILTAASIATLIVAMLPLLCPDCIQGHDVSYHLLRVEALKEGILSGHPFSKVNALFFGGRGYASSMFYPDALLYFPALLRCIGVSINASWHIFIASCIILSYMSMYLMVRLMTSHFLKGGVLKGSDIRPKAAGVIAAVCYTLAQYHVDDIYTRAAAGEFTAMIFLPLAIYGLYDLMMGGMKRPAIMAVGMSGLILTHTATTIFVLALYIPAFVYALALRSIRGRLRSRWFVSIATAAVFVITITAFYWTGAAEQFLSGRFYSSRAIFDLDYEKLMAADLFLNKNPAFGIALPLLWFVSLMLSMHVSEGERKLKHLSFLSAAAGFFFIIGSTGFLPWKKLQGILGFVQFPWRLLIIATAMLSVSVALYFSRAVHSLAEGHRRGACNLAVIIVFLVMTLSFISNLNRMELEYYSYSNDYYSYVPFTGSVIGGEWLPESVKNRDALIVSCDTAVTDYGGTLQVERTDSGMKVSLPSSAGYIDVPYIYYKGYAAKTEDGKALELDGRGENGAVRIYSPPEGVIEVYYKGTGTQRASMVISIIAFLAAVLLYSGNINRRKK